MKLINRTILFLFVSMLFPVILKAQEPDTKIYKIEYEVISKQTLLDINGKVIKQRDSVYLQTDDGELDSAIVAIASSKKRLLSNVNFGEKEESARLYVNPFPVYDSQSRTFVGGGQVYYTSWRTGNLYPSNSTIMLSRPSPSPSK